MAKKGKGTKPLGLTDKGRPRGGRIEGRQTALERFLSNMSLKDEKRGRTIQRKRGSQWPGILCSLINGSETQEKGKLRQKEDEKERRILMLVELSHFL